MANYIGLGTAPTNEPCSQIGNSNNSDQTRNDAKQFLGQLRNQFGQEPRVWIFI